MLISNGPNRRIGIKFVAFNVVLHLGVWGLMSRFASCMRLLLRVNGGMEQKSQSSFPWHLVFGRLQCCRRFCNKCIQPGFVVEVGRAYCGGVVN